MGGPFNIMQRAVACLIFLILLYACVDSKRGHGGRGGKDRRGGRGGGGRGGGRHNGGHKRPGGHHNSNDSNESNESHEMSETDCQGVSRERLQAKTVFAAKADLKAKLFLNNEHRYATAVRIAFHDCVGGCDGCINRNNPDNFGFMFDSLDVMDKIYDEGYKQAMSRADFYILTGVTALEESLQFNNANLTSSYLQPVRFNFKYGRCDCPTSPSTTADRGFPGGHLGYQGVMDFFRQEFGFNERESVAIMGAHTLGGASGAKGSGFDGFWKENGVAASRLNNRYYTLLADGSVTWENLDRSVVTGFPEERWQWVGGTTPQGTPAPFMLNADVCLIKDIQTNSKGKSSCQFKDCAFSPSARYVLEFAGNGDSWMREFSRVWDKMVAKGARKLRHPA